MNATPRIVLASGSPRRRQMFADLKIPFEVIPADIEELMQPGESPVAYARRAATEKGQAVGERLFAEGRTPWIVSADTVVVIDGEVLGKPKDIEESRAMIARLSGRTHTVVTGWAVGKHGGQRIVDHASTDVTFHELWPEEIDAYAATSEGLDKAGAYAIQGVGTFLVDRIEGNYFNVVGLPISHVARALKRVGAIDRLP